MTKTLQEQIDLSEILKRLNIEEYEDRILNSNSHGELFHVYDYFNIYETLKESSLMLVLFSIFFKSLVKFAEENWERPESIFQHMPIMLDKHWGTFCDKYREILKDE